eukprot:CAMPEP_0172451574 /NCGR_PEP_ID=MMETSP1065-20121228/9563_1 /TAXON_ID=265537 /ORGANISM="Amphiprora paludosa, Strain CCMP125" /LENGTH=258 /DNA_ID=CAMNT_0013203537 /DNA_START=55 /DNA_END=831 /DNA_ORIENTATION=+
MIPRPVSVFEQRDSVLIASRAEMRHDGLNAEGRQDHDDDGSDSSTMETSSAASAASTKKRHYLCCVSDDDEEAASVSRRRRRVRFNEGANESLTQVMWYKDECKALWYTRQDQATFKSLNTENAKDIIRSEAQNTDSQSYRPVMEHIFEVCCQGSITDDNDKDHPNLLNDFQTWVTRTTPTRLGLERLAVRALRQDKSRRRSEMVQTVLDLQEEYADGLSCPAARAQLLAHEAQQISQPSRRFATLLARAQAAAATTV